MGRARERPPALLVLLDPGRRLRRVLRAGDAGRRAGRRFLLRQDLRRGGTGRARRRDSLARVDRSYRIYPAVFEPNFHELEYFVPIGDGPAAVAAMRELMLARRPGHGLLGLPARRRSPARRVRGPGALGQAPLPDPRAAACAV